MGKGDDPAYRALEVSRTGRGSQQSRQSPKSPDDAFGVKGKIPEIKSLEVGVVIPNMDQSYDLALDSTFGSLNDLKAYQRHPEHLQVVHFLRKVQSEKAVADFEI